jgi:flagellar protein FliO/FliZ
MKFFFVLMFLPAVSYAAESGSYIGYTLKAFGSLLIVVALMFFAMYALKKINIASRFKSSRIKVIDRLYIDNKHSIVIAEIDNAEYVLGVGEDVNLIEKLRREDEDI